MLVTDLVNVRYLTGYTGSNGLAIVGPDLRRFLTDFRYASQVEREVPDEWARDRRPGPPHRGARAARRADQAVGVRRRGPVGARARELAEAISGVELVAAGGMVEALRAVKDDLEVARIRGAAQLADEALDEVLEHGLAGRTEREVAFALEMAMRRRGADGASFESIVASGADGALPHATPRDVQIQRDMLVTIDWGAGTRATARTARARTRRARGSAPRRATSTRWCSAPSRRRSTRWRPARRARSSTRSRATSSTGRDTRSTSATGSATASAWRSTRGRGCRAAAATRRWRPATW